MTSMSHTDMRNSLSSERERNADEASAMDSAYDRIKECEDAVCLLLKPFDSDETYRILEALESVKGIAGARRDALR
jgi:hypothetical protein